MPITLAAMECDYFIRSCCAPCLTCRSTCSISEATIVLEVIIRGRHLGAWRGLPPTGRHVQFPLCGVYTFDEDDRLAGEKIYYDRATVLRQLGVFHEPDGFWGRINVLVMHPRTMARVLRRLISRPDAER
jgi:SnoaL-like polyketide cyclase